MTLGPNHGGAPGQGPVAPPPDPGSDREQQRATRRRIDRVYGIALLVVGIFATIVSMSSFTENALAQQYAMVFEQYGVADYARPAGLATLSLIGIIGQPVIYALTLYLTLIVWRRGKMAAWIPLVGAVLAIVFSGALVAIGAFLHPELIAAITASAGTPLSPAAPTP